MILSQCLQYWKTILSHTGPLDNQSRGIEQRGICIEEKVKLLCILTR